MDFKIETRYATPVKTASWIKLTDESVQDIVGLQSIANDLLRKKHDLKKQNGILFGDGIAPNGLPVTPGTSFPQNAQEGDFALRLDYYPNRLFRYSGTRWIKYEDDVRTNLTPGDKEKAVANYGNVQSQTQRSSFVNNTNETATEDRGNIPERQPLSKILKPQADN